MTRHSFQKTTIFRSLLGLLLVEITFVSILVAAQDATMKIPLSYEPYTCMGPRSMVTHRDWWVMYADRENILVYEDRQGSQLDNTKEISFREQWAPER